MVAVFVRLVLSGISLRGASRALEIVGAALGFAGHVPHWTTGRWWLQRLGLAALLRPKEQADDWVWLLDHSVQIGKCKCLVILGIRLRDLPPPGQPLCHQDLVLLALVPMETSTAETVYQHLEATVPLTGVPRVLLDDHGSDLVGGASRFQAHHPDTVEIYDIKHKAACVLKARLEKDPRWQKFQTLVGQTRCAIQQTELAFLVPPGPKPKARFMNLAPLLTWGTQTLTLVERPPAPVLERTRVERLQEKLGWLTEFRAALSEWGEWQAVVDAAVAFVGTQGYSAGAADALAKAFPAPLAHPSSAALADALRTFAADEAGKARPGERLPGSTEVLESCFGKFKALEKDQAKGGFTQLLLAFGSLVADTTSHAITAALQLCHTHDVVDWCARNLGMTIFAQRKQAYAAVKAQQN